MTIYVISVITYDCHRFQETLNATLNLEAAKWFAEQASVNYRIPEYIEYPVILGIEDSHELDREKCSHILIEEFQDLDREAS